jgi:hypothetical protein
MDVSHLGLGVAAVAHAAALNAANQQKGSGGASRAAASSAKVVSFNNPL